MNIKDLEIFLVLASTENMQQASIICNKTPSMLSKSLKRLEVSLEVKLFDRIGKSIKLNAAGLKLRINAAKIVAQAKQTFAECSGIGGAHDYTIAAPSILLFRWASVLSKSLQNHNAHSKVIFNTHFEGQALEQLIHGLADIAVITSNLANQIPEDMHSVALGVLNMQVAAGKNHPLVNGGASGFVEVSAEQLLVHPFVSPSISPYCGQARGIGCDGWRNDLFPRQLKIEVNDYSVLGQLVRSGQALAYLPDYWVRELELIQLQIKNFDYVYQEKLLLVSYQSDLIDLFKP